MNSNYEQKLEATNWKMKNNGYEIVGKHGARSSGFYPGQVSKGCDYIEKNFDKVIEFLKGCTPNKDGNIGMRISGIGIVFEIRPMTAEENKARSIMNKLGLGEREPEVKQRTAPIYCNWYNYYKSNDKFEHGYGSDNRRVVAHLHDSDKVFEARLDGVKKMMRLGRRLQFDENERVWTCEWQDWMTGKDADSINFYNFRSAEAKLKKLFRKYLEA